MGKRLNQQRRGRGTQVWRSPSFKYAPAKGMGRKGSKQGVVMEISRDSLRSAPVALVEFVSGEKIWVPAAQGLYVGQKIQVGDDAPVSPGNMVKLSRVPEGRKVFCLELKPGDGGRMVRTAGNFATVLSKEGDQVKVKLPSGSIKYLSNRCKAIVGSVAGMGSKDKPVVKAGVHYHIKKAKHRYWPRVSAGAMNNFEHPFGGGRKHCHIGMPQTASRHRPPGRKVGSIAAKRMGRKR